MKLNWFSPLLPARTDIAHYTSRVLPELSKLAEVTLWTDQREFDPALKDYAAVRTYRLERMPWADLNRADITFYQIGNNPLFHGSIWQISRLHAGVIVLHDQRLHHFFDGLYRVKWRDLNSYLAVMETHYGDEGRRDAKDCFENAARNIAYMAERYPLTALAVENALGVVVHTRETFDLLARDRRWPLVYAPLPFGSETSNSRSEIGDLKSEISDRKSYRLIVFGYIGRNRRLESILQALANLPERAQFQLDIYGEILDDEDKLRAQIRALDLKAQVTLHGFTTEAKLDAALAQAHLAINLRYPTMGEASGSQLRIWAHSLPSLVSRVGWYASLPADAVAFVRPDENEVADIQSHLRAFVTDGSVFTTMGRRGRKELDDKHAPDQYAHAMVKIAERARDFRAATALLKLADRAALLMSDWYGPTPPSDACAGVAKEIRALAGGSFSG